MSCSSRFLSFFSFIYLLLPPKNVLYQGLTVYHPFPFKFPFPNSSYCFRFLPCSIWALWKDKQNNYTSSRFFENQPYEICSHLRKNASKGTFRKPEKLQNHGNEGKGKEKRKERGEGKEEKKRKDGCTISFYDSYFEDCLWPKKPFDAKGLFGDDVIKNPARHISLSNYPYLFEKFSLLR